MKKINKIRATALSSFLLVFIMVGAAYAAVPLYKLFCQVTGFAGTTQKANSLPTNVSDRVIRVQFDANVGKGLSWDFSPLQREVSIKVGEEGIAFYTAKNLSNKHVKGSAVFNVTPVSVFATIGNFLASSSISLMFADPAIKLFFIIIKQYIAS